MWPDTDPPPPSDDSLVSELVFAARVLGIDPGLTRCGYAVIDARGWTDVTAVALGVIRTSASEPLPQRLATLRAELATLIAQFEPAAVAVEHVFFQVNVRTAMSVGQASGLALAEAAAAGCEVAQYTQPGQGAVAGWGGASKEQVQRMVQARLGSAPRHSHPTPPTPRRWPCATSLSIRCGDGSPRRSGVNGDRIPARRGARAQRRRNGAAGGRRRRLRRRGHAAHLGRARADDERLPPRSSPRARERADALRLRHPEERTTFQTLIATHGVGPALAMAILATHPQRSSTSSRRRRRGRSRWCRASDARLPSGCSSS